MRSPVASPMTSRAAWLVAAVGAAACLAVGTSAAPAQAAFGIETFENSVVMNEEGTPASQAGSHPYAMTTTMMFNHHETEGRVLPDEDPKNVEVNLPAGLVVNPTATETRCTEAELEGNPEKGAKVSETTGVCPDSAAVGVVTIHVNLVGPTEEVAPVYNIVPPAGTPAELGFNVAGEGIIVHVVGKVRTGSDYGLSADVSNVTQRLPFFGAKLTLWGSPSDASHDKERGRCRIPFNKELVEKGETCPVERTHKPLLTMPGLCTGGSLVATMRADSWQEPEEWTPIQPSSPAMPPVQGCDRLDFSPSIFVKPEPVAVAADSPSGLSVDLKLPQEESFDGLVEANLKDAVVTLPAGMAVSPSAANGLQACTREQIGLDNAMAPSCPDASRLGSVEVVTPLLEHPLEGSVYLAQQGNNPFASLIALYLVAEGSGALIKLAGHVELGDGANGLQPGQIRTSFDNNPQLPFSELKLKLFGGERAPLVTPSACGTYATTTALSPWSGTPPATPSDSFAVESGCAGGFSPSFSAGTTDNQAGAFSPFSVTFSRADGQQRLAGIQVKTPPGLLGVLKSVARCPEPQASQGTCGPESLIGHTTTGAGPGTDPFFVGGDVFLTGPYNGNPFGLSIVVHALAGPFDLGFVTVRAGIAIDPRTAQITVTSDPLPTILQGVPLDLRTVNVTVDRPRFMFNPTSCSQLAVSATITSTAGAATGVSSPFQAASCASLPFKPKFTVSTPGKTSKANGAGLVVKVVQSPGEADIHKVDLQLPAALPSRLTTLQKACSEAQFATNPAGCPAASVVGTATAVTPLLGVALTGPAYLVSHGGAAFPDVVFLLQGEGVRIELVGNTDIKKGVTFSRFETVPDAPISSFETDLPEGPHSALAANGSLCAQTTTKTVRRRVALHRHGRTVHVVRPVKRQVAAPLLMPTTIVGQNGAQLKQNTKVSVRGCPSKRKAKAKPAHRKAGSRRK